MKSKDSNTAVRSYVQRKILNRDVAPNGDDIETFEVLREDVAMGHYKRKNQWKQRFPE